MEILIIIIMGIFILLVIKFLIKISMLKSEIVSITNQLNGFKLRKTNKKITVNTGDKKIIDLASEINKYIELYKKNEQEKLQYEKLIKQGIENMAHDLRTPLTSIVGYLKLLKKDEIDKNEAISIMEEKAARLTYLINDFFELASIESDEYEIEETSLNLTNILNEEVLSFYNSFEEKGLRPQIEMEETSLYALGDKESTERVIDNVISNSLKYSDGYIKINLSEERDYIKLIVSNTCSNITENDVYHMFDRFYMADKVRKGEGFGLGLSITKALMEKMGGSIEGKLQNDIISIICIWKISHIKN